jgi:hypothetical protein
MQWQRDMCYAIALQIRNEPSAVGGYKRLAARGHNRFSHVNGATFNAASI